MRWLTTEEVRAICVEAIRVEKLDYPAFSYEYDKDGVPYVKPGSTNTASVISQIVKAPHWEKHHYGNLLRDSKGRVVFVYENNIEDKRNPGGEAIRFRILLNEDDNGSPY